MKMKINIPYYIYSILGEVLYLKYRYKQRTGKTLSLKKPQTFTAKLQFLKLHDRRLVYTKCADKIEVKRRVSSILGDRFVIPTLKVFQTSEELQVNNLPDDPVIIKTNHDSGGTNYIRTKSKIDFTELQNYSALKMKVNFFPILNENTKSCIQEFVRDTQI